MNNEVRELIRYACQALDWPELKGALAQDLYEKEMAQIGRFNLKNPKLSPSPIYFNFRTPDNPNPGPLTQFDINRLGSELFQVVGNRINFSMVAGIPYAGEPFAVQFSTTYFEDGEKFIAHFYKTGSGDSRRISGFTAPAGSKEGDSVLIIDDVLAGADTKFEAIKVVEDAGYKVAAIVVIVDREQGGLHVLQKRGYRTISVFRLSQLLAFYVLTEQIPIERFGEIMGYIERSRKIIAAS